MLEQMTSKVLRAESAVKMFGLKVWGWVNRPVIRWLVLAGGIFAVVYILWLKFWLTKELKPGQVVTAQAPKALATEPTKVIQPQRGIQVYERKEAVAKKLGLPAESVANPHTEVQAAFEIPKMKYGGKGAAFVNMSTGKTDVQVKANSAPWFSFEKGNTLGVAAGASSRDGVIYKTYYQRDFLQIKGVYVSGRVEAIMRPDAKDNKVEGVGMIHGEYRW